MKDLHDYDAGLLSHALTLALVIAQKNGLSLETVVQSAKEYSIGGTMRPAPKLQEQVFVVLEKAIQDIKESQN